MAHLRKQDKEMSMIIEAERYGSVVCKCTNRIPGKEFGKREYAICHWCNRRIYKDAEKQKKYDLKQIEETKRFLFKKEMEKRLCI